LARSCIPPRAATEQITGRQIQAFGHPAVELAHVGFFEGVAEAEHRHFVAHLGEGRQRRAADTLGRRVAGDQFGCSASSALSSLNNRSYSASGMLGSSRTW
jgi:hypothetical protein